MQIPTPKTVIHIELKYICPIFTFGLCKTLLILSKIGGIGKDIGDADIIFVGLNILMTVMYKGNAKITAKRIKISFNI